MPEVEISRTSGTNQLPSAVIRVTAGRLSALNYYSSNCSRKAQAIPNDSVKGASGCAAMVTFECRIGRSIIRLVTIVIQMSCLAVANQLILNILPKLSGFARNIRVTEKKALKESICPSRHTIRHLVSKGNLSLRGLPLFTYMDRQCCAVR